MVSVVVAVTRELEEFGKFKESTLAATALVLAAELDGSGSSTSKAMVAKELRDTLAALRALAPPKREADRLDEVNRKREERRRSAGA